MKRILGFAVLVVLVVVLGAFGWFVVLAPGPLDFAGSSTEQTTTQSTQGLLLEGLRLIDESNRDTEENVLEA